MECCVIPNSLALLFFLPSIFLQPLALSLLFSPLAMSVDTKNRILQFGLFLWLVFMQVWVYTAAEDKVDPARMVQVEVLKEFNLGDFVQRPGITVPPQFLNLEKDLPSRLKTLKEYSDLKKIIKLNEEKNFKEAYVECVKFSSKNPKSELTEWLLFAKGDFLYQAQESFENPKYKLVLEDYQEAARNFPLHSEIPRALYQIALLHLKTDFYAAVETTVQRALREYKDSKFVPYLYLISGEQALLTGDNLKATVQFDEVIRRFPRSEPAIDAAFRKAYLVFKQGKYKEAYTTYANLEKYHSDVFTQLKLKKEPSSTDKYLDRIYYAETVYLNAKYEEASELFQGLANIFPRHEYASLLWIRFGDSYLKRHQVRAAINLYGYVVDEYTDEARGVVLAKIRLADTYYVSNSINAVRKSEDLINDALRISKKEKDKDLFAYALAKLILFYKNTKVFPKEKQAINEYRFEFDTSRNHEWVEQEYINLLELEILDHYKAGDYLAALTIYLVHESNKIPFKTPEVLLRLSDAARSLGLLQKASEILNRVIYIESDKIGRQEALLRLIEILIHQGEIRKASERLRRFNFAYPQTEFRHLYEMMWAELYNKLENSKRAIDHYERAVNAAKNNPNKLFDIRFAYIEMGDQFNRLALPLRSIDSYENYIKLYSSIKENPLDTRILTSKDHYLFKVSYYKIADTYFSMRDFVKSLSAYQRVSEKIKEEPFLSHAKYRIGECYLALNDRDSALKAFTEVSADNKEDSNLWKRAADSYIKSVQMEVTNGIRVFN